MLIRESRHIARKKHRCNACEWIDASGVKDFVFHDKPTYAELRAIARAKRNNWCIMPGQEYIQQVCKTDGDFWVWRALPEIDAICRKYDLYEFD